LVVQRFGVGLVIETCAFLDASKALNKVLHNGIFLKLLQRGAPAVFVRLLKRWYSGLHCSVKWNNLLGEPFSVACVIFMLYF